jgi:hypothetical protein
MESAAHVVITDFQTPMVSGAAICSHRFSDAGGIRSRPCSHDRFSDSDGIRSRPCSHDRFSDPDGIRSSQRRQGRFADFNRISNP